MASFCVSFSLYLSYIYTTYGYIYILSVLTHYFFFFLLPVFVLLVYTAAFLVGLGWDSYSVNVVLIFQN